MITEQDVILAAAGYPNPVTADNFGQAWAALKIEMECQRFAKRTGLLRSEIQIVVNGRIGKAFPQWIHAIPSQISVR